MSNAIEIARRLKLPRPLLKRARKYLKRRKGQGGELAALQQLRQEVETARADALVAQHAATRERDEFERKKTSLLREAEIEAALHEKRLSLKPQSRVHVKRFDAVGTVVRVDAKKQTVQVSIGFGQWEVPLAEVTPQD